MNKAIGYTLLHAAILLISPLLLTSLYNKVFYILNLSFELTYNDTLEIYLALYCTSLFIYCGILVLKNLFLCIRDV